MTKSTKFLKNQSKQSKLKKYLWLS